MEMLCIGPGPGPKNVLVLMPSGERVVMTYSNYKRRSRMSDNAKQYRVFTGIVQWDPRDGEAAGKKVRNATIRSAGLKEQSVLVSLTLWPSHAGVEIKQGDVVTAEGVFTRSTSTGSDGESRTYNNLSVSRLLKHGSADAGVRDDAPTTTSDDEPDDEDDDIPY